MKKLALSELERRNAQKWLLAALSINGFNLSGSDGCARARRYLKVDFTYIHVRKMNDDPRLIIAFAKAIEESAGNGFSLLDRDSLIAIHRALMTLKDQIETALDALEQSNRKIN